MCVEATEATSHRWECKVTAPVIKGFFLAGISLVEESKDGEEKLDVAAGLRLAYSVSESNSSIPDEQHEVCVCVCVCVRALVCMHVCVCVCVRCMSLLLCMSFIN